MKSLEPLQKLWKLDIYFFAMALALSFALEPPLEEALFVAPSLAIASFDMPLFVVLARDVLDFDIVALAEPAFDVGQSRTRKN